MKRIGIRELKSKTSGIVKNVAESRATYVITKHGKAMGILTPPPPDPDVVTRSDHTQAWNKLFECMDKLASHTTPFASAVRELEKSRK